MTAEYTWTMIINIYDLIGYFDGRIESLHDAISEFVNEFYDFETDCGVEYYGSADNPHEFWKESIEVPMTDIVPNLDIISNFEQRITRILDKEFKSWTMTAGTIRKDDRTAKTEEYHD